MQKNRFKNIAISNRITVLFVLFLAFFIGIIVSLALTELGLLGKYGFIVLSIFTIVMVFIIFKWVGYSSNKKIELIKAGEISGAIVPSDPIEAIIDNVPFLTNCKARILFACFASHMAVSIVIVSILVFVGLFENIEMILKSYFYFGWLVTFPLFWKLYSSKLK